MGRREHNEHRGRFDLRRLRAALLLTHQSAEQLWIDYITLGGMLSREALADALAGRRTLDRREYLRLTAALNDALIAQGRDYRVTV